MDKQEVEITQRMTVAALAEAMNKDFGKNWQKSRGSGTQTGPRTQHLTETEFLILSE